MSRKLRVTRQEVIQLLCSKLSLNSTLRANRLRVITELQWSWFGTLTTFGDELQNRKLVGISSMSPNRRDFVRVSGPPAANTCLTVQILAFVEISGFTDAPGLSLPEQYCNPPANTKTVTFALVRWLAPHPDAILRDSTLRPIACAPLDINHAMWTFATTDRNLLTQSVLDRHIDFYDGDTMEEKLSNVESEKRAWFDFCEPETFSQFVNCTQVNLAKDVILETITLPFI